MALKTNPVPLGSFLRYRDGRCKADLDAESMICEHPLVQAAMMFGRAQFQAGVLVDPVEGRRFDGADLKELNAFRDEIWCAILIEMVFLLADMLLRSAIERANEIAPAHSRLFKEVSRDAAFS